MNGLITNIQRFSIHDGPGIRTTVFLKGCPLSCIWCQNPEAIKSYPEILFFRSKCVGCKNCITVCPNRCFRWKDKTEFKSKDCDQCGLCLENCPSDALDWSSREISADDVLKEILKDKLYYDLSGGGITLSGGEPLNQAEFSQELVSKSKNAGLHVAVDTSGCVTTEVLMKIMPFIDLFLYDIKFIDDELYKKYTGESNVLILKNFRKLYDAGAKLLVRIPLIPKITDTQLNLSQIKNFIEGFSSKIEIIYIPFNELTFEKYQMIGKEYDYLKEL